MSIFWVGVMIGLVFWLIGMLDAYSLWRKAKSELAAECQFDAPDEYAIMRRREEEIKVAKEARFLLIGWLLLIAIVAWPVAVPLALLYWSFIWVKALVTHFGELINNSKGVFK